jgi:hypothetical protein
MQDGKAGAFRKPPFYGQMVLRSLSTPVSPDQGRNFSGFLGDNRSPSGAGIGIFLFWLGHIGRPRDMNLLVRRAMMAVNGIGNLQLSQTVSRRRLLPRQAKTFAEHTRSAFVNDSFGAAADVYVGI